MEEKRTKWIQVVVARDFATDKVFVCKAPFNEAKPGYRIVCDGKEAIVLMVDDKAGITEVKAIADAFGAEFPLPAVTKVFWPKEINWDAENILEEV